MFLYPWDYLAGCFSKMRPVDRHSRNRRFYRPFRGSEFLQGFFGGGGGGYTYIKKKIYYDPRNYWIFCYHFGTIVSKRTEKEAFEFRNIFHRFFIFEITSRIKSNFDLNYIFILFTSPIGVSTVYFWFYFDTETKSERNDIESISHFVVIKATYIWGD